MMNIKNVNNNQLDIPDGTINTAIVVGYQD